MARALLLIIDSFGIGALPDAHLYGDEGANTALSICQGVDKVQWTNLQNLGLGNAAALLENILPGCEPADQFTGSFAALQEASSGKDTTTGHWELAGILLDEPFTTFPLQYPSFPDELLQGFTRQTGYEVLGNKGASGVAIIEELGEAHLKGDGIIVYTSADSVFQIAAHNDIVPIDELYSICQIARTLCDKYKIGRVIARPFIGVPGNFERTGDRRDFSMLPTEQTILQHLQKNGVETVAVGKIGDIFSEQGIDISHHDSGNKACLARTVTCLSERSEKDQFIFVNLVDTDMYYGHRRDIQGYHDAVRRIDEQLPEIIDLMQEDDILLISADHGCDPGFKGSDHTREYVPLLMYQKDAVPSSLGVRQSFCDVAQSLASFFNLEPMKRGVNFINSKSK